MKRFLRKFLFVFLLLMGKSLPGFAQLLPPLSLEYERAWTDVIKLSWQSPNSADPYELYDLMQWLPINYFDTTASQDGLVSDGKFLYSSFYYNNSGTFYKYTMDGTYLEEIVIEGLPIIYKMTFDGTYFYGICYNQPGIYQIDMNNKKVVSIIPTPMQDLLHICYIPDLYNGEGGFEVGNPGQGYYVSMQGDFLGPGPYYSEFQACASTAYYNGYLYAYCQIPGSMKGVVEFDIKTSRPTGKVFDLGDLTGALPWIMNGFALNIDFVEYPSGTLRAYLLTNYSTIEETGSRCYVFKIGERADVEGLKGYNLYKNEVRQNTAVIDKNTYTYEVTDLEEGVEHLFTLKGVYTNDEESVASETLSVRLTDTRVLPFTEDFSKVDFTETYWTLHSSGSPAWSIITAKDNLQEYLPSLHFNYRYSADYEQIFISRKLKAGGEVTHIKYNIACEAKTLTNEWFNIEVLVDGEWKTAVSESCVSIPAWTTREHDITSWVADKEFQIRFRVSGSGGFTTYNWYLDNVRVWSPDYVSYTGVVETVEGVVPDVDLIFSKTDDINLTYTTKTDGNGNFSFSALEKGVYQLAVYRDGNLIHTEESYVIETADTDVHITIPVALIALDNSSMEVILSKNKTTLLERVMANNGSASWNWQATLQYHTLGTGKEVGQNDISTTPAWKVEQAVLLKSSQERGLVIHQGYLYSIAALLNGSSQFVLNKYTKAGEFVQQYTIDTPEYYAIDIASDGETLYQVYPSYMEENILYPIDLENQVVTEENAITLQLPAGAEVVQYAVYDPLSDGFYVGSFHTFYLVDREGKLKKTFDITGLYCHQLVVDTFTEGGPYVWLFSTLQENGAWKPQLILYSLVEERVVNVIKVPSEFSEFTGSQFTEASGLFGSTELVPGYFSIGGLLGPALDDSSLYFIYSLFPYESWVKVGEQEGTVEPGNSTTLSLEFSSLGLQEGEEREATLILYAPSTAETIEIPLKLTIDNSIDEGCFVPENLQAEITADYAVQLNWALPEGANPLKGYNVYCEGVRVNTALIMDESFTDSYPKMGTQSYTVAAFYESGVESYHSEPVEVFVSDPAIVRGVSELAATVVNQSHVELTWKTPGYGTGIFDDFESYEAFIIDNIGEWTLYDRDRAWTYGVSETGYYNRGSQMAFMVFNPGACYPAADIPLADNKRQMLACFGGNIEKLANDDWLVSPLLTFDRDFTFSFMAQTYTSNYGYQQVNIGYSLTDNNPESFIFLNGETPLEISIFWGEYEYTIPKEAKYVAINCVTEDGFLLLIDNIYIGHKAYYSDLVGYNVYRNGEKINSSLISQNSYQDYSLANGEYIYEVEAVFANDTYSKESTGAVVINKTHEATPPRDLNASMEATDKISLSWTAPLWSEQHFLRYDDGVPYNSTGYVEEEQLIAIRWEAGDLKAYEGYTITGVEFYIADKVSFVTPFLFVNRELVVELDDLQADAESYVSYQFSHPVTIQPNTEYLIGYAVKTPTIDSYPRSYGKGPGTPYKSDLISIDAVEWYSAYQLSGYSAASHFNWNIAALVELRGEVEEPVAKVNRWKDAKANKAPQTGMQQHVEESRTSMAEVTETSDKLLGYAVYRDDMKLNESPVMNLVYEDTGFENRVVKYQVAAVYEVSGEVSGETIYFDPTGMEEHSSMITFYPNPAKDKLYIEGACQKVSLLAMDGKILYTTSPDNSNGGYAVIELNSYPAGIYLLAITRNGSTIYEKLIIEE